MEFYEFLFILDTSPLPDMSSANSFSQSVVCLLILLTVFFTEQLLILMKSTFLSTISFMDCTSSVQKRSHSSVHKKSLQYARSPRFSPMLSSRSFIILHFTFRSDPF